MPRKKKVVKKKIAQKQKQSQKQSVVVNINTKPKKRVSTRLPKVQPSHVTSINPIFQFPQQYDNISPIISAIQGLNRQQGDVIRDVVREDVAESTPAQVRQQRLKVLDSVPQYQGLSSEEYDSSLGYESLPESLPVARKKRIKRAKINIVNVPAAKLNVLPSIQEAVREPTEELKPPPSPYMPRSESQFEQLLKQAEEPTQFPSRIRERVQLARERAPVVEVREISSDEAFRERLKQYNKGLKRDDPNAIRLHTKNTNTGSTKKKTIQELQQEARDKGLNFLFTPLELQPVEPAEPAGFSFQSSQPYSTFQEYESTLPTPPPSLPERKRSPPRSEKSFVFEPQQVLATSQPPKKSISEVISEKPISLYDREQALLRQKIKEEQEGKDTSGISEELLKVSDLKLKPQPLTSGKIVENTRPIRTYSTQLSFETGAPVIREDVPAGKLPVSLQEVTLPSGETKIVRGVKAKAPAPIFKGIGSEEI
jgi:hypothetical protein